MERLTLKEVMVRVNLSYNGTTSLVRRMRNKGLAKQVDSIKVKYGEIKIYGFTMSPEEYLFEERQEKTETPLPVGFFNNPFNLKGAVDARYNT
jgi:predicted transcriptional regulator